MNISTFEARATKFWFDEDSMWLNLSDGRQLSVPLVIFHACIRRQNSKEKMSRSAVAARACNGMKATKTSAFPTCLSASMTGLSPESVEVSSWRVGTHVLLLALGDSR